MMWLLLLVPQNHSLSSALDIASVSSDSIFYLQVLYRREIIAGHLKSVLQCTGDNCDETELQNVYNKSKVLIEILSLE